MRRNLNIPGVGSMFGDRNPPYVKQPRNKYTPTHVREAIERVNQKIADRTHFAK